MAPPRRCHAGSNPICGMNEAPVDRNWSVVRGSGGESRLDRFAMISRETLARFSKARPARVVGILAFDFGVIGAAAWCCERFWSPGAYLLAIMIIGARQIGIGSVGLHDGAHGLLLPNRRYNDLLAELLTRPVFLSLLNLTLTSYRKTHFEHHRHTNDAAD